MCVFVRQMVKSLSVLRFFANSLELCLVFQKDYDLNGSNSAYIFSVFPRKTITSKNNEVFTQTNVFTFQVENYSSENISSLTTLKFIFQSNVVVCDSVAGFGKYSLDKMRTKN